MLIQFTHGSNFLKDLLIVFNVDVYVFYKYIPKYIPKILKIIK